VEERRNNLAVGKITRCSEEDHDMWVGDPLNAQPGAKRILCPFLCRRLSRLLAEPQIANRCVPLSGRLRTHSDFTEWPPN
jgi:hypothetical protein